MEKISFELREPPLFRYGQKLYVVSEDSHGKSFDAICPACDDKKTISYRGMELKCPLCQTSAYKSPNSLYLRRIVVEEYIVNGVVITGPDYKRSFGNDMRPEDYPTARFSAFCRTGNGYNNVKSINLHNSKSRIDPELEKVVEYGTKDYLFTTKSKAALAAQKIVERDKQKLLRFNSLHGTNYEYPFD